MNTRKEMTDTLAKVPTITLGFWVLKILATTLGETGGDAFSMSLNLGYLTSTGIFAAVFATAVYFQIRSRFFHPVIYWITIIATTTVGTTLADFFTRSLGLGYTGGTSILLVLLLSSLSIWRMNTGSVSVYQVANAKTEAFYWSTIMFSQTLGTALGDWTADTLDYGYLGSIGIFGSLLLFITILHFRTSISRTFLFWSAFILTRPLGAVLGDFLDKPLDHGGLNQGRFTASGVIALLMIISGLIFPQKAATKSH
jgi:uncharacterized membrane-anchored protein